MQENTQRLVPGRECGACRVCCAAPSIDTPEIQKLSNSPCRHSLGGGCDIYETRPPVCRAFFCGWRRSAAFPDDWRPDQSGIFAMLETNTLPPYGPLAVGINLVGNASETVRRPDFIDFVIRNLRSNIALYLMLPDGKGKEARRLSLNDAPLLEAASRSPVEVGVMLEQLVQLLASHPAPPHEMIYRGHDVST
jgi:hypothetical protein